MGSETINTDYSVIVTACGQGSRMKEILGDKPKYEIEWRGKNIIQHIGDVFTESYIVDVPYIVESKVHSRIYWEKKEAFRSAAKLVSDSEDAFFKMPKTRSRKETLAPFWGLKNVFVVDCDIVPSKQYEIKPLEYNTVFTWDGRPSGIYFIKDMAGFLTNMEGDNMMSGFSNGNYIELLWETKHFGTPEEYHKHMAEQ